VVAAWFVPDAEGGGGPAFWDVALGWLTVAVCAVVVVVAEPKAWRLRAAHTAFIRTMARRRRAGAWDQLLRHRALHPGSRIRRRPLVRIIRRRALGWELVDPSGRRLADVPRGAPESWVAAMREQGLSVLDL
jgi:hypothetical protein